MLDPLPDLLTKGRTKLATRTSVYLPPEARLQLRQIATSAALPQAEVIRRAIDCARFLNLLLRLDPTISSRLRPLMMPRPIRHGPSEPFTLYIDTLSREYLASVDEPSVALANAIHLYQSMLALAGRLEAFKPRQLSLTA